MKNNSKAIFYTILYISAGYPKQGFERDKLKYFVAISERSNM